MTHDYTETLYNNLFNVLNELTERESPEVIFDRIVEDFAMNAEYYMGKADTFKSMLDTFRHDNPAETIPEFKVTDPKVVIEDLYGGITDINKQYMLEDRDKLMDFLNGRTDI